MPRLLPSPSRLLRPLVRAMVLCRSLVRLSLARASPLQSQTSKKDTTRQSDLRTSQTGAKGSTSGASLPTGTLPPFVIPAMCSLSGAPATMTAASPSCRPCSLTYTDGSATLWTRAPTCTPCARPTLGAYWSGSATCSPKTLIASLSTSLSGMQVTADPAASSAPAGAYPITSWTYNFGDGSPTVTTGSGAAVTHTYATAGTYTITLTVANSLGDAPGTSSQTVTIIAPPCVAGGVQSQTIACPVGQSGLILQERSPITTAAGPGACPYPVVWTTTSNTCVPDPLVTVTLTGSGSATASLAPAVLTVTHPGVGSTTGSVAVVSGSTHTLTITTTAPGHTITAVSGCTGATLGGVSTTCTVTPTAATTITATLTAAPTTTTLTATASGTGSGTVRIAPAGIGISHPGVGLTSQSATVTVGTLQTVTVTGTSGARIASLTGCSGGTVGGARTTCTVTPSGATTVAARFSPATVTLSASLSGSGSATVRAAPAGLSVTHTGTGTSSGRATVTTGALQTVTITATGGSVITAVTGCTGAVVGGVSTTCTVTPLATTTIGVSVEARSTIRLALYGRSGTATLSPAGHSRTITWQDSIIRTAVVPTGGTQTITATAVAGSRIISMTGCTGASLPATTATCLATPTTRPHAVAIRFASDSSMANMELRTTTLSGQTVSATFLPGNQYATDPGGYANTMSLLRFPAGTTQTMTISAINGAVLSRITGCAGATLGVASTSCTFTATENGVITAVFTSTVPNVTVSTSSSGPGRGYLSMSPTYLYASHGGGATPTNRSVAVPRGRTQVIRITTENGARINTLTGCPGGVTGVTTTTCTITPLANWPMSVSYRAPPATQTLTTTITGSGTATATRATAGVSLTHPGTGTTSRTVTLVNARSHRITFTAGPGQVVRSIRGCNFNGATGNPTLNCDVYMDTTVAVVADIGPTPLFHTFTLIVTGTPASGGRIRLFGRSTPLVVKPVLGADATYTMQVRDDDYITLQIASAANSRIASLTGCSNSGALKAGAVMAPAPDSSITVIGGPASASGSNDAANRTCSLYGYGPHTLTVAFEEVPGIPPVRLTGDLRGDGDGTLSLTPGPLSLTHTGTGVTSGFVDVIPGLTQTVSITATRGRIASLTNCPGGLTGGTTATCAFTPVAASTVGATIRTATVPTPILTLNASGDLAAAGSVGYLTAVASKVANTATTGTASLPVANGQALTITISAPAGSRIRSVTGCTATGTAMLQTCAVTVSGDVTVTADFALNRPLPILTATLTGTGEGTLAMAPATLTVTHPGSGTTTGTATGAVGSTQTITLTALNGSTITSVTGCTGASTGGATTTCTVLLTTNTTVGATFAAAPPVVLTGSLTGAGTGSLTTAPASLSLIHPGIGTTTGNISVPRGSTQTVTITATGGSTIASVTGCSGATAGGTSTTCTVTPTSATTISVQFAPPAPPVWLVLARRSFDDRAGTVSASGTTLSVSSMGGYSSATIRDSVQVPSGTPRTVSAVAGSNAVVFSLTGCSLPTGLVTGRASCTVRPTSRTEVLATFASDNSIGDSSSVWVNMDGQPGQVIFAAFGQAITHTGLSGTTRDRFRHQSRLLPSDSVEVEFRPNAGFTVQSLTGCGSTRVVGSRTFCKIPTSTVTLNAVFGPTPSSWLVIRLTGTATGTLSVIGTTSWNHPGGAAITTDSLLVPSGRTVNLQFRGANSLTANSCGARGGSGVAQCTVTVTGTRVLHTGTFSPLAAGRLNVTMEGEVGGTATLTGGATGTLTHAPRGGTSSRTTASYTISASTQVTFTAAPGFVLWYVQGCNAPHVLGAGTTRRTCTVSPTVEAGVTAAFRPTGAGANITVDGPGTATVRLDATTVLSHTGTGISNTYAARATTPYTVTVTPAAGTRLQFDRQCENRTLLPNGAIQCTVENTSTEYVRVSAYLETTAIRLTQSGAGSGTVEFQPHTATSRYAGGAPVTTTYATMGGTSMLLIFRATNGSTLGTITGCTATGDATYRSCPFVPTSGTTTDITVRYDPPPATSVPITLVLTGSAYGHITMSPSSGVPQGTSTTLYAPSGSTQTLSITSGGASYIASVTGCRTSGGTTSQTCTITPTAPMTITATFEYAAILNATVNGNGTGTVAMPDGRVRTYVANTGPVTYTALVGGGTRAITATSTQGTLPTMTCAGGTLTNTATSRTCSRAIGAGRMVTSAVTFRAPGSIILTGNLTGTSGTMSIAPASLTVNHFGFGTGTNSTSVLAGTTQTVTLTSSNPGSVVNRVTGCTGFTLNAVTTTCTVTPAVNTTISARFGAPIMVTVTGSLTGTGTGSMSMSPGVLSLTHPGTGTTRGNRRVSSGSAQTVTITATGGSTINTVSGCTGFTTGGTSTTCTLSPTAATTVAVRFAPAPLTLTGVWQGTGRGSMTAAPAGISVSHTGGATPSRHTRTVSAGSSHMFQFTAEPGHEITSIVGCSSTTPRISGTCALTVNVSTTVTATISPKPTTLSARLTGTGSGTLSVPAASFSVRHSGSGTSANRTTVTDGYAYPVTITATGGSSIGRISGCSGGSTGGTSTTCLVTTSGPQTVSVRFSAGAPTSATLTTTMTGTGIGIVTISPVGDSYVYFGTGPERLTSTVPTGTTQTLTLTGGDATMRIGAVTGCTGATTGGTSTTCTITPTADATVSVRFDQVPTYTVTLRASGTGGGSITGTTLGTVSKTAGGADRQQAYTVASGTRITATATAPGGSIVRTITGCSSTGTTSSRSCTFTVTGNVTLDAVLDRTTRLTVQASGTGQGMISTSPTSLSVVHAGVGTSTNTATVVIGTTQTLTISVLDPAHRITSLTGCSGGTTGGTRTTCTVTPASPTTVSVGFTAPVVTHTLTLNAQGDANGSGTVSNGTITATKTSGGANASQATSVISGSTQTITMTATGGSTITSVSGCVASGSATVQRCTVSVTANTTITAYFQSPPPPPPTYTVTLQTAGTGGGTVSSSTGGSTTKVAGGSATTTRISVTGGTSVTFTGASSGASTVGALTGCASSGTRTTQSCTVTVNSNLTITGTFTAPTYRLYATLQTRRASVSAGSSYTVDLCRSTRDAGAQPITNFLITRNGTTIMNRGTCGPVTVTTSGAGTDNLVGTVSNGIDLPGTATARVSITAAAPCTLIGAPGTMVARDAGCTPCTVAGGAAYWSGNPQCVDLANQFDFFPDAGSTMTPPAQAGSLGMRCSAGSLAGPTVTVTCSGSITPYLWNAPTMASALYAGITMSGATFVSGSNNRRDGTCTTSASWSCSYAAPVFYSIGTGISGSTYANYGNLSGFFPQPISRSALTMTFTIPNVIGSQGSASMPWQGNPSYGTGTAVWTWRLRKVWF